ncbi:hypothetical protein [Sphingobium phenoxybenzoativorans]|uniref:hypothetical protein n=1 Tax=Sphingobium phenoxybenzoativorans TaxID=1592790 RepID=UPI000871F3B5|nr:hypothetical protein [Sphingobium phenoxybenzoativorans]
MKVVIATASAALFGVCVTSAQAQSAVASTQPESHAVVAGPTTSAVILAAPTESIVRTGTPIALKTSEPLTTEGKKLKVGQRIQIEVAEAVMLNGQTVIAVGSPGQAEITDVRNKGMWGKSGRINARVLYVRANGRQIRMTGQFDDKGVTGTAGVVAAIAFVPIAGFITTGTSAKIPLGSPVKGFLDEDLTVAFVPATPAAPIVLPAGAVAVAPAVATVGAPPVTPTALVQTIKP